MITLMKQTVNKWAQLILTKTKFLTDLVLHYFEQILDYQQDVLFFNNPDSVLSWERKDW